MTPENLTDTELNDLLNALTAEWWRRNPPPPPPQPEEWQLTIRMRVASPAGLNRRKKPSLSSEIVGRSGWGEVVEVFAYTSVADGYMWREVIAGGWLAERSEPPGLVFLEKV